MQKPELFPEKIRFFSEKTPEKIFLQDANRALTYRQVNATVDALASRFIAVGMVPGDRCIVFMNNGLDYALIWLGLAKAGIVSVLLNQAYKGDLLAQQIRDVGAQGIVADSVHWKKICAVDSLGMQFSHVFCSERMAPEENAISFPEETIDIWQCDCKELHVFPAMQLQDTMSIFYTSGTTGPSKGVLYTHKQAWQTAYTVAQYLDSSDVFYMTNPMCHVGLPHCLGAALCVGGTVAVRERFSVSEFWDDVRKYRATVTMMLGTVASFIVSVPETDNDRDHTLRKVLMVPVLKDVSAFCRRFDVAVMSWFNMTEVSVPLHTKGFSREPDMDCGYPRVGAVARIVDAYDYEVDSGVAGELVLRDELPWSISPGYVNRDDATVAAWRNQWFHTGDLFIKDATGRFFFLDRMKDCIRRRGENISSFEVESQILAHQDVVDVAVVGVKMDGGEEEVKAVVVLQAGSLLTPSALLDYLQPRLPYFTLPRYVLFQETFLPKTSTGKVMKHVLRDDKHNPGWDREAAGYKINRS